MDYQPYGTFKIFGLNFAKPPSQAKPPTIQEKINQAIKSQSFDLAFDLANTLQEPLRTRTVVLIIYSMHKIYTNLKRTGEKGQILSQAFKFGTEVKSNPNVLKIFFKDKTLHSTVNAITNPQQRMATLARVHLVEAEEKKPWPL